MDMKVMESEAHAASSKLAAVIKEAQEMIRGHEKLMSAKTEHALTVIGNLRCTLAASRKKANTLNSATAKLKLLRLKEKDRYRGPTLKSLQAENAKLLTALDLSKDNIERALADCANTDNVTSWVNMLGKKGQRYNMYVKEMGMQLMASELSASQAVYCLTVFMMKTHPDLVAGVDYRIPGESVFKEWAESIYDVVCELNRSRLDEALIIYYKLDDSPRNKYNYHGMNSECLFEDDTDGGKRVTYHVPLGLEILKTGEHQPMADKASAVLDTNIVKVPAVMSDNAAKDVGVKIFAHKAAVVKLLKTHEDMFSEEELEIMSTNFVDTCITHCGDLASKKHHDAMEGSLHSAIVKYNAATLIQNAFAIRYIKQNRHAKGVWLKVCARLLAGRLGRVAMCHTPMKLESIRNDAGTIQKCWKVTGEVSSVYKLMCSMSNLISNQGVHSTYYLNESKDFRLFWVCFISLIYPYINTCNGIYHFNHPTKY
jgi:hypothetical protein